MNYVGIDLHRKFSQVHVFNNETQEATSHRMSNDERLMTNFFNTLDGSCKIAVEATGNWYWLIDLLQAMGYEVLLSNPVQTKAIAKARIKNDKVDARTLAHLLKADLLPICWIPDKADRNVREFLRFRLRLIVFRTGFKNVIRSVLAKFNINLKSNIWAGDGRDDLEGIITPVEHEALGQISVPMPYDEIMRQCLKHIDILTEQINYWIEKIHQHVSLTAEAQRLLSVPGIGELSALTIIYESGPIGRFPSAKHYASYAGLVPRCWGSADKYWNGPLFKQANMYLKRIYMEAVLAALKAHATDVRLKCFYQRTMKRKGKSVAKVAVARKMAGIVYHMLKHSIDYRTCMARNRMAERASLST